MNAFVRLSAAWLRGTVANPTANTEASLGVVRHVTDSNVVLSPRLCVTACTCLDLFGQRLLLYAAVDQTLQIAAATRGRRQLVFMGLPVAVENGLYNCAAVLCDGPVLGRVSKRFFPN
jgi:NAD+ synthase (glutamine-hydrolysing)